MQAKKKIIKWGTFIVVTLCLFLVGHLFHIEILKFPYVFDTYKGGLNIEFGSFVPFLIGIIASVIAGFIYDRSLRKKGLFITVSEDTNKNNGR